MFDDERTFATPYLTLMREDAQYREHRLQEIAVKCSQEHLIARLTVQKPSSGVEFDDGTTAGAVKAPRNRVEAGPVPIR